jgi:hypothetical protein
VIEFENEPFLYDNEDGNWTATWELVNPNNYTFSNVELSGGKATLKLNKINFIEDSILEFRNGTFDGIMDLPGKGLGLDLRRDRFTLIADEGNDRVVEIDYDK